MDPLNCQEINYETIDVSEQTGVVGASSIKLNLPPITDEELPTVSIVVPTYNRQAFFSLILRNWERIDYPREKLELIILDDSDNIPQNISPPTFFNAPGISYHRVQRVTIGGKRNLLANLAKHKYIVHMDDDDWYPPESVAARIRCLLAYEKSTGKPACVGCSKVLCLDLVTNQMFEAYDESNTPGLPATLSESTMAYSKIYWEAQKWDFNSVYAECLPFLANRHQTVCVVPSVFVVTQFTHGRNTVQRRVGRNSVSEYNAIRFTNSLSAYDAQIYNKVRANVVKSLPGFREAIGFIQKCQGIKQNQLKKVIKKTRNNNKHRKLLENPLVIEFMREALVTKTTTSGKDIVYYCGPGDHFKFSSPWNPNSETIGGSEEAVIGLTNCLASLGYRVTVYCVLKGAPKNYNGVYYRNHWEWIPKNLQDITIIWRDPSNCKLAVGYSKQILLDVHDAIDPIWLKGLHKQVKIMTKSLYHKHILDLDKYKNAYVIPNGIKSHNLVGIQRKRHLMICTSSPDRCVRALLRAMPLIRSVVPDAEIHWAYGFRAGVKKGGMEEHDDPQVRQWVKDTKKMIKNTPGFKNLGRLSQEQVEGLYQKADMLIYPTVFPEIDCISLSKAMANGAIPIVTPSGAMAEKMGAVTQMAVNVNQLDSSLPDGPVFQQFVQAVIQNLQLIDKEAQRQNLAKTAYLKYSLANVVEKWVEVMELRPQNQKKQPVRELEWTEPTSKMILEAGFLKKVIDLIKHEVTSEASSSSGEGTFLEIVSSYEHLSIGANYDDRFYIEFIRQESENDEEFHIVMSPETFEKIHQLVNLWPKSVLQIVAEGEHQMVEVIDTGKLIREKPVQVDCIFEEGVKDYSLNAPEMQPNISVNAKNLRQMLEFCQSSKKRKREETEETEILLTVDKQSLLVNNESKTLGTRVECEEFFSDPKYTMKLSAEANRLIISFLTKLGIKSPMIYLMFLEREYAFSIKVKLSNNEEIQIYTIHEI